MTEQGAIAIGHLPGMRELVAMYGDKQANKLNEIKQALDKEQDTIYPTVSWQTTRQWLQWSVERIEQLEAESAKWEKEARLQNKHFDEYIEESRSRNEQLQAEVERLKRTESMFKVLSEQHDLALGENEQIRKALEKIANKQLVRGEYIEWIYEAGYIARQALGE